MSLRSLAFILTLSLPFASAHAGCIDWLLGRPAANAELQGRVRNEDKILKDLEIRDGEVLQPIAYISEGTAGTVIRVKYHGKNLVLKLFNQEKPRSEAFVRDWENEISRAVIIQQYLSEQGIAPKVAGILNQDQIHDWLDEHIDEFSRIYPATQKFDSRHLRFGLLMEEFEGTTSKDFDKPKNQQHAKRAVTKAEFKDLLRQAAAIDKLFTRLKIIAMDSDVVITPDNRVMLIDLSLFYLSDSSFRSSLPRVVEHTTRELLEDAKYFEVVK